MFVDHRSYWFKSTGHLHLWLRHW